MYYPNQQYNPYDANMIAQQRLQQMQQAYQPQQMQQQAQTQQVQPTAPTVNCKIVTGLDEAKASTITFDGQPNLFLDTTNNLIYIKKLNMDGTVGTYTYKLDETPNAQVQTDYVSKQEFNNLQEKISKYEVMFNELMGGNKSE